MNSIHLQQLTPALLALIPDNPIAELGAGNPNREAEAELSSLHLDRLFAPHTIVDAEMAAACHSGLWLAHNFLDESHTLSQSIETTTGSYWHGIMHRREGDFSNAKYWFRKVGQHPVFAPLQAAAAALAEERDVKGHAEFLATQTDWDPMAFIDLCEWLESGRADEAELAGRIARQEWELLMQYSFNQAIAN